jgi:acetyl-CoA carboxylase alpha subunit
MAQTLKKHLVQQLNELQVLPIEKLLDERYKRLMAFGLGE